MGARGMGCEGGCGGGCACHESRQAAGWVRGYHGGDMGFIVRTATAGDAVVLSALAIEVWLDTYAAEGITTAFARHVLTEYSPDAMLAALRSGDTKLFLCHAGEQVLGYARLRRTDAGLSAHGSAELGTLYVRRHHTGQGVGSLLLRRVEQAAHARGHRQICATVNSANRRALGFYARSGWHEVGSWLFRFEGLDVPNVVLAKALA